MRAFLDFEASSLSERSYPIEVAWVFEGGESESHLIRPAPRWDDWDTEAEAIHGIPREELVERGTAHEEVARRMVEVLAGHHLYASAPSWDGKWLSALLRAADLPRHSLRVTRTDDLLEETAQAILASVVPAGDLARAAENLVTLTDMRERGGEPAHRALADAEGERQRWLSVREAAWRAVLAARKG